MFGKDIITHFYAVVKIYKLKKCVNQSRRIKNENSEFSLEPRAYCLKFDISDFF